MKPETPHKGHNLNCFGRGPLDYAIYESSSPYSLGRKFLKVFSFCYHGQPEFFMGLKILKCSENESLQDYFCEVSLKSFHRFQRRRFFK